MENCHKEANCISKEDGKWDTGNKVLSNKEFPNKMYMRNL